MTIRLALLLTICFRLAPLTAQDTSSLSAVQLNAKGFSLYEERKFEESLACFRASFEKDQEYSYPHYNYACVLSILRREKGEITEHLLKAFFLDPQWGEKYFSDPDLEWFRRDPEAGNPHSDYLRFSRYRTDIDVESTRELLLNEEEAVSYRIFDPTVERMFPGLPRLVFSLSGAVQATQHPKEVGGKYWLAGNLVYVELDDSIEIRSESGSFPMKRIILMCDSDDEPARDPFVTARRGLVLLRDSLRPIEVWHETPGSGV